MSSLGQCGRPTTPELEESMGLLLSYHDMARSMEPPEGTSARDALDQYARALGVCAGEWFGAERWASFIKGVRSNVDQAGIRL